MARTLPIASLLTAAIVLVAAPGAWAQTGDADVPVYLLARAAVMDDLDTTGEARGMADATTVAVAAPAVATQPRSPLAPDFRVDVKGRESRGLALPALYVSLGVLQGMDFYTTQKGMALGAHETNGLVRNGNSGRTMALKVASTTATIFIAERMWKKNKAGAIAMMVATNVVFGAVVANNQNVIRQLR